MVDYRLKAATIEVLTIDSRTPFLKAVAKIAGMYWRRALTWIAWRIAVLLRLRSR